MLIKIYYIYRKGFQKTRAHFIFYLLIAKGLGYNSKLKNKKNTSIEKYFNGSVTEITFVNVTIFL